MAHARVRTDREQPVFQLGVTELPKLSHIIQSDEINTET